MATTSPSSQNAGRRVRHEHRNIRAALRAIEALLDRPGGAGHDAEFIGQALEHLEGLARDLAEHFAREEAPEGIFAKALAEAPRLERRVLAVREQHGPLGTELEQMIADMGHTGLAPDAWRKVAERFRSFAETLRSHERAEGRILTAAYLDDLGSGD